MAPPVSYYMTPHPYTISRRSSLAQAHAVMREHAIRHLPVVDGADIVGIVSVGDLHLLETIAEFELDSVEVDEAMTENPYVVSRDAPVHEVAQTMAEHKYGCAIVRGEAGVDGIFTTVDALRVLANLLWPVPPELERVDGW